MESFLNTSIRNSLIELDERKEVPKLANSVEEIMQLEVDESFKKGVVTLKRATKKDFLERYKDESIEVYPSSEKEKIETIFESVKNSNNMTKILLEGKIPKGCSRLKFLKEVARTWLIKESVMGYYDPDKKDFYVIHENINQIAMILGLLKSQNIKSEELLKTTIVHELAHKTHGDHYKKLFDTFKEKGKAIASLECEIESETFKNYSLLTKVKTKLEMKKRKDESFGTHAYIEGIGQYVQEEFSKKVMGRDIMKEIDEAKGFFERNAEKIVIRALDMKDMIESYNKGCTFLRFIEEKTGKNPLTFTYDNPPINRKEIEHPQQYLKRV